ncbi:MAG TPA: 3-methyl-2-oxobutanoate hydroxymethyltransferase [Bacillota bacterium]|nr:3-methyl-2-oxobutanoate hydroxymethyltransferase [Bacillota bacterium]
MSEITVLKLRKLKESKEKIVMVTAYDFPCAKLVDEAGVDVVLVGDSLGVAVLGYESELSVTMADMLHHTKAVSRGVKRAMVVGDMPFLSYQVSPEAAVANAGRFLQEAGAQAVKLEGGAEVAPLISRITTAGIPVFGHLGFTPQSINQIGGPIFQGKTAKKAEKLLDDALSLEAAGACAIVLELIPWEAAELISSRLKIPTIGIGSGPACDGQVLVFQDLLEYYPGARPKRHNKVYAPVGQLISDAVKTYAVEVRESRFPVEENTRRMEPEEYQQLVADLKDKA